MRSLKSIDAVVDTVARHRRLLVPVGFLLLVVVLVVPLPPLLLDLLLTANLALATVVLLTTIFMARPLEFSVFPAVLLGATLFRLVLNVASTRLILTADAPTAADAEGVAGGVIEAFGGFMTGDSIIVGAVIFLILVVVQFVVVTKGATRMSEVAARFTLDALPGKQMAIDAELASGVIEEDEARSRRAEIMREADFYGAMDGASKFVRGDAVAGVVIIAVNVIGGFAVGAIEKGWGLGESLAVFTRLTVGDGLVSQVPAFLIAIAAGLIVARSGEQETLGEEMPRQLASQPIALVLIASFLGLLAFTPLPTIPLLLAAGVLVVIALAMVGAIGTVNRDDERAAPDEAAAIESLLALDTLELEVGYRLVPIVDSARGGDVLERISVIRRRLAIDLGIVVPPIRIRDDAELDGGAYRVRLRGAIIGEGTVEPDRLLVVSSDGRPVRLEGVATREPAFGVEAAWVDPRMRERAEAAGYAVADAAGVLTTHLGEILRTHAAELLTREEVGGLLDELRKRAPKLVEEVVPTAVTTADLQRVLRALLREDVPVRDLETILETLADPARGHHEIGDRIEDVRFALRRTICGRAAAPGGGRRARLACLTVERNIELWLEDPAGEGGRGGLPAATTEKARGLVAAVSRAAEPMRRKGLPLVIVTTPTARRPLRRLIEPRLPDAVVLSHRELIADMDVETTGLVQLNEAARIGAA